MAEETDLNKKSDDELRALAQTFDATGQEAKRILKGRKAEKEGEMKGPYRSSPSGKGDRRTGLRFWIHVFFVGICLFVCLFACWYTARDVGSKSGFKQGHEKGREEGLGDRSILQITAPDPSKLKQEFPENKSIMIKPQKGEWVVFELPLGRSFMLAPFPSVKCDWVCEEKTPSGEIVITSVKNVTSDDPRMFHLMKGVVKFKMNEESKWEEMFIITYKSMD